MALSTEARRLLRKGLVISAEVPAASPERMAWVGVHPFVHSRSAGKCSAPGLGQNRFAIRSCEALRSSVEASQDLEGQLVNERETIVNSEEQVEAVLAAWGVDSSTLERERSPYPY